MIRDPNSIEEFLNNIRKWVRDVAIPNEDRVAELHEVPQDLVVQMQEMGYFGWGVPEEFGGSDLTTEELVLAAFELSYCATAFRAYVGSNTGIGSASRQSPRNRFVLRYVRSPLECSRVYPVFGTPNNT